MTSQGNRALSTEALARVEGEGAMHVRVTDGRVDDVRLQIYEPPRFFEAFLRGRQHTEPPDITARICGICPVAYQMSAALAIEDACAVTVDEPIQELRRLLYCGEWISSHVLHIYLLHAPDFLGYPSVVEMARDHRAAVERGLSIKKLGNEILAVIGGRAIHPINFKLGGFYRAPDKATISQLAGPLHQALADAIATVDWVASFNFPDFTHDHELLALVDPGRYAIMDGNPRTDRGLEFSVRQFDQYIIEEQVPHSTALHARLAGRGRYLTGPLARYGLSHQWLAPPALEAAHRAGLGPVVRNPFQSIVVRSVEVVHAIAEAIRIVESYEPPAPASVDVPPRAGCGWGATEAPRGTLFHRYNLDEDGKITQSRIVPPTSQNQASVEDDLRRFVETRLDYDDQRLTWECEQAIRNYDPCISCSAHFLDLTVQRG